VVAAGVDPDRDRYRKSDGSLYESGTEWEFEQAVTAKPLPHVLVYHRTSPPQIVPGTEGFAEKSRQLMKLDQFLSRFEKKDGVYRYGINTYESPQQFRDRLTTDLRTYVQQQLEQAHAADAPRPTHEPPYPALASALSAGEMIPFIGPGLLASHRAPAQYTDPSAPTYLPSSVELSQVLADEAGLPTEGARAHLTEVASYYEAKETRVMLRERLRQIFGSQAIARAAMPPLYTMLATLDRPLLVITTNFDTLLERAFLAAGRPYDWWSTRRSQGPRQCGAVVAAWRAGAPDACAERTGRSISRPQPSSSRCTARSSPTPIGGTGGHHRDRLR